MSDASTPTEPERDAQAAQEAAADEAPPSEAVVADASAPVGDPAAVEHPTAPDEASTTPEEAPEPLEPAGPEPPQEAPEPLEPTAPEPPQETSERTAAAPAEPAPQTREPSEPTPPEAPPEAPEPVAAAAEEPPRQAAEPFEAAPLEAPPEPPEPVAAAAPEPPRETAEPGAATATADGEPVAAAASTPAAEPASRARRRRPRGQGKGRPPRRDRPERGSRGPRERGPLPFGELREAATAVAELFGPRRALREAFSVLGDKERADLARLVSEDGDWRVRARNISAGSLGAGRVGKALAAQQVSMARIEDLWALTLSKEEAAERQARVRNSRRRDERRAQRDADRESRSDRVSRAELAKAQDGRVGATIRIVMPGEPGGGRRRKDDEERPEDRPDGGSDMLDRLGY
jgi:translation initiation factor IF-2